MRIWKRLWLSYAVIGLLLIPINSYNYWKTRQSFWRWMFIDNMNAVANSMLWPIALPHQLRLTGHS